MLGRVADLPPALRERLHGRDVIVFDGVCVLCAWFFRFMLRFDRKRRFVFATAQSEVGQGIYRALNLPLDDFETNIVIIDGLIYGHLDAFAAAMGTLGWPFRLLSVLRILPQSLAKSLYLSFARNRYQVFGRFDTCMIPSPEVQARFLAGGFASVGTVADD
ncbi:MAG: DCC1-like thiol-disulfide oxidoreductase family protein [Pseudomonadota bacterium]